MGKSKKFFNNQNGVFSIILGVLVVLVIISVGAYLYISKNNFSKPKTPTENISITTPSTKLFSIKEDCGDDGRLCDLVERIKTSMNQQEYSGLSTYHILQTESCPKQTGIEPVVCQDLQPGQSKSGYVFARSHSENFLVSKENYGKTLGDIARDLKPLSLYKIVNDGENTVVLYSNQATQAYLGFLLIKGGKDQWNIDSIVYTEKDVFGEYKNITKPALY